MGEFSIKATNSELTAASTRSAPKGRHRTGTRFYLGMSGALFLIVLIGFGRSLYLNAFLGGRVLPLYLWIHGIVLTIWFVGLLFQTALVVRRRTDIHRRFGWVLAAVGGGVFVISAAVVSNLVPRISGGNIERLGASWLSVVSLVVWSDVADLLAFAVFLSIAIALRRHTEAHKRLMLLASVGIIHPAIVRTLALVGISGPGAIFLGVGGLVALLVPIGMHDVFSRKRLHPATLLGASSYIAVKMVSIFVIATSEIGRSFVRRLV
jgi:hypothetical protein